VNDDPLIGISEEDQLLITTYFLPVIVIKKRDGTYEKRCF
jgi:trehalose 6-phosphate synthase/phosphatase